MNVSGMLKNLGTPCLAVSPKGDASLVWAETDLEGRWRLKQAGWLTHNKTWSGPRILVSQGDPRFPSAAYNKDGALWVACSADAGSRREVQVFSSRD